MIRTVLLAGPGPELESILGVRVDGNRDNLELVMK